MDLAETDENGNENEHGNENGNENENGKGRQTVHFMVWVDDLVSSYSSASAACQAGSVY